VRISDFWNTVTLERMVRGICPIGKGYAGFGNLEAVIENLLLWRRGMGTDG
jgi:hypothetical protein